MTKVFVKEERYTTKYSTKLTKEYFIEGYLKDDNKKKNGGFAQNKLLTYSLALMFIIISSAFPYKQINPDTVLWVIVGLYVLSTNQADKIIPIIFEYLLELKA